LRDGKEIVRVASYRIGDRETYGVLNGQTVKEASEPFRRRFPDLRSVLAADALALLEADSGGAASALTDIDYLPVIPNPDKVICVGVNYLPHIQEWRGEAPDHPLLFVRFAGSQVGHRQPLVCPAASTMYDFEGELAIVIGRPARHVKRDSAYNYVAGYCCFMDGTVRDWQDHTSQFTPGKNFHKSGAMGPHLVTRDEIDDPTGLRLETRVNGEIMQTGGLDELIFDIPALIEYCSTFTELLPGDVIATGTPGGVGAARNPPRWLASGDRVSVEIDSVGRLENVVRDASLR